MNSLWLNQLLGNASAAIDAVGAASMVAMTSRSGASPPTSSRLNFDDPRDNLYAFGKIWAGFDEPQVGAYHGLMYGRIGNQRLNPLFGYTGTGVMQAKRDGDGNVWIRGKETGFFTDLATGEILETWDNPYTGERVRVFNFLNPAMGGRLTAEMPRFALGAVRDEPTLMNQGTHRQVDGRVPFLLPFESFGDELMLAWDYAHEYTNPVTPERWPKASTGMRISPSEHFMFNMSLQQMRDRDTPSVRYTAGFARISQWWPWMLMGGHRHSDGVLFGRMFSHKGLPDYGDVPPKVLAYIEKHIPEYLEPPAYWPDVMPRGTWEAYAEEVPPEVATGTVPSSADHRVIDS